jgi:hypothetical protein
MANFRLFARWNGIRKFIFLSWQKTNENPLLLFQQTCPSMNKIMFAITLLIFLPLIVDLF